MNDRTKTIHDHRAFKAFVLMILTATAFTAFAGIGAEVGLKRLIGATISLSYAALCRCVSITVCDGTGAAVSLWNNLTYHLQAIGIIFFWVSLGVLGTGILKALIKALTLLLNDRRFIKDIPIVSIDEYPRHKTVLSILGLLESFVLFRDDGIKHSFTLGMWRPKMYMSTGTYTYLTDEEFLSAILHEDYHRRHKDPFRLFTVTVLRELLFFLPISNHLTKTFLEAKEKAADDNAVYLSGRPLELASAIVKLVKPTHVLSHAYLANSISEMDTVEERVRRLVEPGSGENTSAKRPSRRTLLFTTALSAFFFVSIFVNGIALCSNGGKVFSHCVSDCCTRKCGGTQHHETNHGTADDGFLKHVYLSTD